MNRDLELKFSKHILNDVLKTKRTQLPRAIIACSGGIDSIVLSALLAKLYGKVAPQKLMLVYIDHQIRSQREIQKDLVAIQTLAKRFSLSVETRTLETAVKDEAGMRKARYSALAKVADQYQATHLYTAHHAGDVLETWILALSRGVSPTSASGIAESRPLTPLTQIVRPLLPFSKTQLELYAKNEKLKFHRDKTNRNLKYSRNYVRTKVIPAIEKIRPGALNHWIEFFNALTPKQSQKLETKVIQKLEEQKQVQFRQLFPNADELDFDAFALILKSILGTENQRASRSQWLSLQKIVADRNATRLGGGPAKCVQFPGGWKVEFKADHLRVYR